MPVVGSEVVKPGAAGYAHDPMAAYAKQFLNTVNSIRECAQCNYFNEAGRAMYDESARESLKNFFVEGSLDVNDPAAQDAEYRADQEEMLEQLFETDAEAVLEHANVANYNPVVGMTFPIHKNIMMNNIFDKGAIPKFVAKSPKFTVSMETRWLIDPETGAKIDFWREQWKMTDVIEKAAPLKSMYLALPEAQGTNVLQTLFGVNSRNDHLSIESYVSGIVGSRVVFPGQKINVVVEEGGTQSIVTYTNSTEEAVVVKAGASVSGITGTIIGAVFDWNGKFVSAYGSYDRQLTEQFAVPVVDSVSAGTLEGTWKLTIGSQTVDNATSEMAVPDNLKAVGFISGFMKDDRFGLMGSNPKVTGVILTARLDTSSAMLNTATTSWSVRTDMIEIPNAIPLDTTISPEEVKDIAALYQVNQLTKVMSLTKTALSEYKDTKIRRGLDKSYINLPADQRIGRRFDFATPQNYMLDPIEWRSKMFMDQLDSQVTQLLHILNDPNMTINVIGRDDLIRKITPTEYTYQTPSNIGPVQLDFVKTVVTSDRRTYQFISSDKLRDTNNLMIILCPRNSDRFMYRLYDYQMYVSDEIRNASNPTLPNIHAFERWILTEYQPVQGRITILNPMGLRNYATDYAFNNDPIGRGDGRGVASVGKNDFDIDAR